MTFTQKYSRKQIRRERPILTNSCPYGIVESETKYLLISSVVCFAYCWRRSYGAPFICVACNEWKALPHNSSAALAMSFPPSAACKFLYLPPVNLRNLHLHLTKNPFASRPPHLRGVTLTCCFYGICLIGFFRCSRRVCGREVVPFWRARKEPKSAQRGLKRVQVWISALSGLPPPSKFLAGGRSFSAGLLDF